MKKLAFIYLTVLSVLTIATVLVMRLALPQFYPSGLFLIPALYTVMLGVLLLMRRSNERKGRDRSYFIMSYRIVKMSLYIFIIILFINQGMCMISFAVIFMIYYLCLTPVETFYLVKEEKKS